MVDHGLAFSSSFGSEEVTSMATACNLSVDFHVNRFERL